MKPKTLEDFFQKFARHIDAPHSYCAVIFKRGLAEAVLEERGSGEFDLCDYQEYVEIFNS